MPEMMGRWTSESVASLTPASPDIVGLQQEHYSEPIANAHQKRYFFRPSLERMCGKGSTPKESHTHTRNTHARAFKRWRIANEEHTHTHAEEHTHTPTRWRIANRTKRVCAHTRTKRVCDINTTTPHAHAIPSHENTKANHIHTTTSDDTMTSHAPRPSIDYPPVNPTRPKNEGGSYAFLPVNLVFGDTKVGFKGS